MRYFYAKAKGNGNLIDLKQGDCLELMKDIPDGSVDMILCDLPYGTTQCKWDSVIPFEPLWEQYNRVIKDNGAIVLFAQEPFATKLRISNFKMYKYDWIWQKPQGTNFLNAKNQPLKNYEILCVFGKKKLIYNPQMTEGKPYTSGNGNVGEVYGGRQKVITYNNGVRYPTSIQHFNMVSNTQRLHPTQKPVELLEYLIKTYTNEGDVVLDNCMGSGSTGVACMNTNRRFIGFELDKQYFEVAKERLKRGWDYEKALTEPVETKFRRKVGGMEDGCV